MWLSKRNSLILDCLVELYISTKKPVSSLQLSKKLSISSSSLRKDLQSLEFYKFLYKPFSSSGRIPTNKGIKAYLKCIKTRDINNTYINELLTNIDLLENDDFSATSGTLLSYLSENTQNIGFVFLNSIFDLSFKRIKLIKVGHHKVMVVIMSPNNWSFPRVFETIKNYSDNELKNWQQILNTEYRGNNLNTTFKKIRNRQSKNKEKYRNIYKELSFLFNKNDMNKSELLFKGELNMFDSDFFDNSKIKGILELLKDKEKLSAFLSDILLNEKGVSSVLFGKDTGMTEFEDLILISSNFYHSDNPIGNIGVIGPRYIHYKETINKVEDYSAYFSKILSREVMEA